MSNTNTTGPVYKGKKHKFVANPTWKQRLGNYEEQKKLPPNTFVAYPEHFEYARQKAAKEANGEIVEKVETNVNVHALNQNVLRELFNRDSDDDENRVPNTI